MPLESYNIIRVEQLTQDLELNFVNDILVNGRYFLKPEEFTNTEMQISQLTISSNVYKKNLQFVPNIKTNNLIFFKALFSSKIQRIKLEQISGSEKYA